MKNYFSKTTENEAVITEALSPFLPEAQQKLEAELCPKCQSICRAIGVEPTCEYKQVDYCRAYYRLVEAKAWSIMEARCTQGLTQGIN